MSLVNLNYDLYKFIFKHLSIRDLISLYQIKKLKQIAGSHIKDKKYFLKEYTFLCVYMEDIRTLKVVFGMGVPLTVSNNGTMAVRSKDNSNQKLAKLGIIVNSYNLFTFAVINNKIKSVRCMLEFQDKLLQKSKYLINKKTIYDIEETYYKSMWHKIYESNDSKLITPLDIAYIKKQKNLILLLDEYDFPRNITNNNEMFKIRHKV